MTVLQHIRRLARERYVRIAAAVLVAAGLIVLGVRIVNADYDAPYDPFATRQSLTVGVVADRHGAAGAEMLRGVNVWADQVRQTSGIPLAAGDVLPIRLVVEDDRGTRQGAKAAVGRAVAEGASVVFGPPEPGELAGAAEQARASRVLLFAPIPRPAETPPARFQTFLSRPGPGDMYFALDALDRLVRARRVPPGRSRGTIGVLFEPGFWGRQTIGPVREARARGYSVREEPVRGGDAGPALARIGSNGLVGILAFGPIADTVRWFRGARGTRAPWVLAADDVASATAAARGDRVAVSIPWVPAPSSDGGMFDPGEFVHAFGLAHGRSPRADAAAGYALGLTLWASASTARSGDSTRILKARDRIGVPSLWGILVFKDGVQQGRPGSVVLLERGAATPIAPTPPNYVLLRRSVPPR
jgi:hypothetical protein